jgi:hypothetical protein
MCNFTMIIQCEDGHVSQCAFCGVMEVLFGTSLIHFEYSNLAHFLRYLEMIQQDHATNPATERNIVLDLALTGILQVVVNTKDLAVLYDMLQNADTVIKQQSLLRLFNQPH